MIGLCNRAHTNTIAEPRSSIFYLDSMFTKCVDARWFQDAASDVGVGQDTRNPARVTEVPQISGQQLPGQHQALVLRHPRTLYHHILVGI